MDCPRDTAAGEADADAPLISVGFSGVDFGVVEALLAAAGTTGASDFGVSLTTCGFLGFGWATDPCPGGTN